MKFGFEDGGIPAAWRFTGDVEVSNEQQHSGRFSLKIHPEAVVRFFFSDSNRVGKVSMWIYDNGFSVRREKENHFGPLWGVMDQDHEKVFAGIMWQSWLSGNSVYSWASSAQSAALRSRFPMGINREKGWRHWEFACRGPGQPLIILCDGQRVDIDMQRSEYSGGLAGIAFFGGWITALQSASPDTPMALYVDDITIQLMDPPPRKKTVQPEVVPAPFPNARVRINERGVTMVHGRPFFPIAVWAQTTGMIPKHKSLGVNTFVSESDSAVSDPVERKLRLLDACQAAGLMAIVQLEDIVKSGNMEAFRRVERHPALLAWMHGDEPDIYSYTTRTVKQTPDALMADYRRLRDMGSVMPVWVNFGSGGGDPWAQFVQTKDYYEYAKAAEMLSFDAYLIGNPTRHGQYRLHIQADGMER